MFIFAKKERMTLWNKYDKKVLKEKLAQEDFKRTTISFYRYVILPDPNTFRNELYRELDALNVFGRIYLAQEGINAQISVPVHYWDRFITTINRYDSLHNMPYKIAVEDDGKSFYKLKIKVRKKIVADGLNDDAFDVTNVGKHLTAREFNEAVEKEETILVDMRNHYESEIGHFRGAICPDADTFREELPLVLEELKDKKDKKVVLYCTGGIRCEKASAYLKHHGFEDVNQLFGGIIDYARQIKDEGLENKFLGKNFVFDERLGETISSEIISSCHQCGNPCNTHTNCKNDDCHLLFIQCAQCAAEMNECCSSECQTISALPIEEQRKLRKGKEKKKAHAVYKKARVRPKLKDLRKEKEVGQEYQTTNENG
jgi:UPF0176 protein